MTTIDQAFIRAYLQQTAREVPKCDAAAEAAHAAAEQADRTARPAARSLPVAELVTSSYVEPIDTTVSILVTETLTEPVCSPRPEPPAEPPPMPAVRPVAKAEPPAPPARPVARVEPPAPAPEPVAKAAPPAPAVEPASVVEPAAEVEPLELEEVEPLVEDKVERPVRAGVLPPVVEERPEEMPAEVAFQPLLQVDGFAWSDRATSLRLAAGIQVDRLADALAEGIGQGRKVAAVAGCGRHQGCTTMLLCVAKRLADRGLKVALMDADFAHPSLGASLGLLPEEGFEAVLAGRAKVEDVAIESVGDEMTVVPLGAPAAAQAEAREGVAAQAVAIDALRRAHDLVLVDVGDLSAGPDARGRSLPRGADAVVAVQDVRSTAQAEVAEVLRRAESEGLVSLGVVENFV